jgi:hypothetical protein
MKKKIISMCCLLVFCGISFNGFSTNEVASANSTMPNPILYTFCIHGYYGLCKLVNTTTNECDYSDFNEVRDCNGTYSVYL